MELRPYPTRNGLPVPVEELGLMPSALDPDIWQNWSEHHLYFNAATYQANFVLRCLRNLERSQVSMLNDQHALGNFALHMLYDAPAPPPLHTAMNILEEAYQAKEWFKVHRKKKGSYHHTRLDDTCWRLLNEHYNKRHE